MSADARPADSHRPTKIAVIGGGISGLSAAHRLVELLPTADITLLESADRLGGVLETRRFDGFLIERSADNFLIRDPWAVDLCQRVGLSDHLLPTNEANRRTLVVRSGRLQPVPKGFVIMAPHRLWPVLTSPILSPLGKLRLLCERWVPRRRDAHPANAAINDESLASFARRRLGNEVFERLVEPLMAGIYTADPERLSLAATMPQFLEMERSHGSLSRGGQFVAPQSESGARYGMFVAPRTGMTSLIEALAGRLPDGTIRLGTAVRSMRQSDDTWHVSIAERPQPERFDAVIIATPVHATARLMSEADPPLAAELAAIESASSVVVVFGFRRDQIAHPLNGFGAVVPRIECRRILAASFASIKFPGRAPEGHVVVRAFVGGALQPDLTERTDVELRDLAYEELAALLGITGRESFVNIARWPHAMPQYHVGHLDRVARIEQLVAEHPGIELAGNAFHGVGIPQCIHSGEQAAQRTVDWLNAHIVPVNDPIVAVSSTLRPFDPSTLRPFDQLQPSSA